MGARMLHVVVVIVALVGGVLPAYASSISESQRHGIAPAHGSRSLHDCQRGSSTAILADQDVHACGEDCSDHAGTDHDDCIPGLSNCSVAAFGCLTGEPAAPVRPRVGSASWRVTDRTATGWAVSLALKPPRSPS